MLIYANSAMMKKKDKQGQPHCILTLIKNPTNVGPYWAMCKFHNFHFLEFHFFQMSFGLQVAHFSVNCVGINCKTAYNLNIPGSRFDVVALFGSQIRNRIDIPCLTTHSILIGQFYDR